MLKIEVKLKIYFAHPVSDYGTRREQRCLELIKQHFPEAEILNPNQKSHNRAYLTAGMKYFDELVKTCDILVAATFPDGEWGMGVWREADAMVEKGGKVFQITTDLTQITEVDHKDIRPLSVNQTKTRTKMLKL